MKDLTPGLALPHNIEAEQHLLGALLLDGGRVTVLPTEDPGRPFFDPAHADLAREIARRVTAGRPATPVAMAEWANTHAGLADLNGAAYLAQLAGLAAAPAAARDLADLLADLRDRREIASAALDAIDAATGGERPAHDVLAAFVARVQAADLGRPDPLPTFTAASLAGTPAPPRAWHVADLIPSRTVTLLGGDGGTGKSLLALQLAVATAAGRAWIGRQIERPGPVLVVSAEDDRDELHRRLEAIAAAEGFDLSDLPDLHLVSLAGDDAVLARPDRATGTIDRTSRFTELEAAIAEHEPALVVLDTLADLFGGDKNSRPQARQFVGLLRGLALRFDCAVVLLAHPSLAGMSSGTGLSGSTAWNASVRSRLYFERIVADGHELDPDLRRLTTKKANYGPAGGEISLKWDAGRFVPQGADETGLDRLAAQAKGERVFLAVLDAFTAQGRFVSASPGPTFAPAQFLGHPAAEGLTKRALRAAMESLLHRGEIVVATHGKGEKARSHLERKGGQA